MTKVIKTYTVDPDLYEDVKVVARANAQTISGIISRHFEMIVKSQKRKR